MKKYLSALVAFAVMMFTASSFAYNPPPAPAHGWYVVDQANVLSSSQVSDINHRIDAISKVTKNEFGVLIVPTMNGENIDDVANSTFRTWGVGKHGLDNGVLIAIAMKEHKWRIEVGKGVEGEVTDLQAADVGRNQLVPGLHRGDVAGGIINALYGLDSLMETRINQKATAAAAPPVVTPTPVTETAPTVSDPNTATDTDSGVGVFIAITLAILLVGGGFLLFFSYRSSQEEEKRREELASIEREQAATRLRNQTILNRQQAHVPVATATPHVHHTSPTRNYTAPVTPTPTKSYDSSGDVLAAAAITAAAVAAAEAASHRDDERREERRAAEREDAEQRRRERDEEDERRRRRDDDDSSSSSSSSSWGGSDSGGGDSGGGGFGGGDSGGGGASGDF